MNETFIQTLQSIPLHLHHVNLYPCNNSENTGARILQTPYLLYIHKGKGTFNIDGVDYITSPGELYYCPPGLANTIIAAPHNPFLLSGFDFEIDMNPTALHQLLPRKLHTQHTHDLSKLILEMVHYKEKLINMPCYVDALFRTFLTLACYDTLLESTPPPDLSQEIIKYIYEHKSTPLTLNQLSGTFRYHANHLNRIVKQVTGLSVHQLIIEYRLNLAKELLVYSRKPIESIALECGYENPNYFSKLFKQRYGISPKDYRNR